MSHNGNPSTLPRMVANRFVDAPLIFRRLTDRSLTKRSIAVGSVRFRPHRFSLPPPPLAQPRSALLEGLSSPAAVPAISEWVALLRTDSGEGEAAFRTRNDLSHSLVP